MRDSMLISCGDSSPLAALYLLLYVECRMAILSSDWKLSQL